MTQTSADPTAAETGANATKVFQDKQKVPATGVNPVRVSALATEVLTQIHDVIKRREVTYAEYDALKAWLIRVGEDGEWPLFLDVFVEHAVEQSTSAGRPGSKGSIEGPFYVPVAPRSDGDITLPMRPGEAGTPLVFRATVTSSDGTPLPGAQVEVWHADADGLYSQFAPGIPEWNLRGVVTAGADGVAVIHTIQPAPYQIPHDGATGALIAAAGWHAWRPAHLHFKVVADGHQQLTTQLYFDGGDYNDSDVASAVKPELVIAPKPVGERNEVAYDFVLAAG